MAKAAQRMLTQSLALELAPEVRVNGIAPGAILWPETGKSEAQRQAIIDHRTEQGPFTSVDQLLDVRGIGDAKLADLRDRVVV